MIASQKIGKSFMGALKYNWNKLLNPDVKTRAKLLSTNFTSLDLAMIKQEVDLVRSLRPNLNRYVYHTSLNFHKDDVLDNKTMLAIAEDYLRLSGFTSNQYFIFRHHDAEHPHVHLLVNRITFDGEVVSDSNNYKKSDTITVQLEQQYNLVRVKHRIHVPVELNNHVAAYPGNRISEEQGNSVADEQYNHVTVEQGNAITGERYNSITADQSNYVPVEQRNAVADEQRSSISIETGDSVSELQYNKPPFKAPTKSELEMVQRTGKPSDKMLLQEKLLRLVSKPGTSLQDFISKCEGQGIHLLFNQASTGRISGITYFYGDFKIKGQALGNRFKWAELIKTIDYEQDRDGQTISQASERTRGIYGDYTKGLHHTTGGLESTAGINTPDAGKLFQPTGKVEADGSYAEQSSAASYGYGAGNHPSGQETGSGAGVDKDAGSYGDWRDHAGVSYIPGVEISDDIDDEAVLGRNRRKQKQARTNTR
jgi:hypothetical protein